MPANAASLVYTAIVASLRTVSVGTLNVWKLTGLLVSLVSVYCLMPQRGGLPKKALSSSKYGGMVCTTVDKLA